MKTVCDYNQCTGCSACVSKCHKGAIHIEDSIKAMNAVIDEKLCVSCGLCAQVCPTNNPYLKRKPLYWKQGWTTDKTRRAASSSGGVAIALALGFIENGGVVCSCTFENGAFVFDCVNSKEEAYKFVGSKYVKSNPVDIYRRIRSFLQNGEKVLFIGLPCQSAAVQRFTKQDNNLYTVDLICHGTPSAKIFQKYLEEKDYRIGTLRDVKFRKKTNFYLSAEGIGVEPPSVADQYTFAFLKGLCYTENCYTCQYAQMDRVSDITLGDSWGSQLSQEEQAKGISLVMCQSEKGKELLEMAELHLEDVDIELAVSNNHQLSHPSVKPEEYEMFWETFMKTNQFRKSVNRCYPAVFLRQKVKALLIKAGIIAGGV